MDKDAIIMIFRYKQSGSSSSTDVPEKPGSTATDYEARCEARQCGPKERAPSQRQKKLRA